MSERKWSVGDDARAAKGPDGKPVVGTIAWLNAAKATLSIWGTCSDVMIEVAVADLLPANVPAKKVVEVAGEQRERFVSKAGAFGRRAKP